MLTAPLTTPGGLLFLYILHNLPCTYVFVYIYIYVSFVFVIYDVARCLARFQKLCTSVRSCARQLEVVHVSWKLCTNDRGVGGGEGGGGFYHALDATL